MGHTKPDDLKDLATEINQIRKLEGLKEKSPGIFYFKSIPFLHFHDKDGVRWADLKVKGTWQKIEINFDASKKDKAIFMKSVKMALDELKG